KCRAQVGFGLDPDGAAVPFGDSFADRQTDAGAGIMAAGMQALEDLENAVEILGVYADAIVANVNDPAFRLLARADVDFRRAFAAEFKGVADEVLKDLDELRAVNLQAGQGIAGDLGGGGFDSGLKIAQGEVEQRLEAGGGKGAASGADAGEIEQVGDELLHAVRAVHGAGDKLHTLGVERSGQAPFEEADVTADGAQRL